MRQVIKSSCKASLCNLYKYFFRWKQLNAEIHRGNTSQPNQSSDGESKQEPSRFSLVKFIRSKKPLSQQTAMAE